MNNTTITAVAATTCACFRINVAGELRAWISDHSGMEVFNACAHYHYYY